jgi:hypothetical protein
MRLMGVRVPDHVGGCPRDAGYRRNLVETCRSESDGVGVGWDKDWGQRSKSDWRLPIDGHVASDHDELHGIAMCVRLVGASHELLPGPGVPGEQDAEPQPL